MKHSHDHVDDHNRQLLVIAFNVCAARSADTAIKPDALADVVIQTIQGARDGSNPDRPQASVVEKNNRPD